MAPGRCPGRRPSGEKLRFPRFVTTRQGGRPNLGRTSTRRITVTTYQLSPTHGSGAKLAHAVELVGFALIVVNVVALIAFYVQGSWIVPVSNGAGNIADFVTFWAVGREILAGHAAAVYDWPTLKAVEEGIVGPFSGYL